MLDNAMRYETVADIFSANQTIRQRLITVLGTISPDEAAALPDDEKWSIRQVVEHLSMVEFGTSRICGKLLDGARADGRPSDGSFALSQTFQERAAEIAVLKLEAPERVHPTGKVAISDALKMMDTNREAFETMRPDLERFDLSGHAFPHPFFGDLTAGEWLVMVGMHEQRHTKQIEKLLEKVRQ